jgi:hypothetical protein
VPGFTIGGREGEKERMEVEKEKKKGKNFQV